jgi:hypothetical protein
LDAAIGQLLAPYYPSGRQGNSKQNNNKKVPKRLAISMAVTVCRSNTVRIPQ